MNLLDQQLIIKSLTGIDPAVKQKFRNPFRYDKKPGCFFYRKSTYIRLADYGDSDFNGINVYDIASYVASGHPIYTDEDKERAKEAMKQTGVSFSYQPAEVLLQEKKRPIEVKYKPVEYEDRHMRIWKPFGITLDQLAEDSVHATDEYIMDGTNTKHVTLTTPAFAMPFKSGHCKIYAPTAEPKWDGYSTLEDIYFDTEEQEEDIFIVEGYKDARVLRNAGYVAKGTQSTTVIATDEKIREWANSCTRLIFLYDPDKAGLFSSVNIVKKCRERLQLNNVYVGRLPSYVEDDVSTFRASEGANKLRHTIEKVRSDFVYSRF